MMMMTQFWASFVKDEFDLKTPAEFSYAIAVMERIEGWKKEVNKINFWVPDMRQECGSFPEPLCVTAVNLGVGMEVFLRVVLSVWSSLLLFMYLV